MNCMGIPTVAEAVSIHTHEQVSQDRRVKLAKVNFILTTGILRQKQVLTISLFIRLQRCPIPGY